MSNHPPMSKAPRFRYRASILVGLATLAWLVATEPRLAMVWDEGYTLGRVQRIRWWFSALADPADFSRNWSPPPIELVQRDGPTPPGIAPVAIPSRDQLDSRSKLFAQEVILYFWPFAREEPHGHPPFYALVGLAGNALLSSGVALAPTRYGTMVAFSLLNACLFGFLELRKGRWAAIAAAGSLALQPRLFAHAHYATYDALLTALWIGCLLTFWLAVEPRPTQSEVIGNRAPSASPSWSWVCIFAVLLGMACATKLTGWLIPVPLALWSLLYRDRRGLLTLAVAAPITLIVTLMLVPPWWHDPLGGFNRFLASNLGRGQSIPIRILFLGKVYNTPTESLPWFNALFFTAFITPVAILSLSLLGAGASLYKGVSDRLGVLVLSNWGFLLLLKSLPDVPGHDNERLFLPAFGLLAVSAGLGASWLVDQWPYLGKGLVSLALLEGFLSVLLFLPVPLAYWSPLIGGPKGAEKLGMEPTYYWDSLTPDVLNWLNQNTPPGGKVAFASQPTNLLYLRATGQLKPPFLPNESGTFVWYVLQNRPGAMTPPDHRLVARGKPAYVVRKFGVPLLWVYPFSELQSVTDIVRSSSGPR